MKLSEREFTGYMVKKSELLQALEEYRKVSKKFREDITIVEAELEGLEIAVLKKEFETKEYVFKLGVFEGQIYQVLQSVSEESKGDMILNHKFQKINETKNSLIKYLIGLV